jgi:hypothetical protein
MWWWIPPAVAASLGSGLSLTELLLARGRLPPVRAAHYVLGRMACDGFAAWVAYLIMAGLAAAHGTSQLLLAITAGAAAPAVLRAQVIVIGKKGSTATVGPGDKYQQIRDGIDTMIREIDAQDRVRWMNGKALPCVTLLEGGEVGRLTADYTLEIARQPPKDMDGKTWEKRLNQLQAKIETVLAKRIPEDIASEEDRMREVINLLLDGPGRGVVKVLIERGGQRRHASHLRAPELGGS